MKVRKVASAMAALAFAVTMAACGSPSDADEPGSSGEDLKVTWLYYGPENDGGYNTGNKVSMDAMATVPGVTVQGIYNVPYSAQASQIVKQAIAEGADVLVDTVGLGEAVHRRLQPELGGDLLRELRHPATGANSASYYPEEWDLSYIAGVASGLTTKSDVTGFIAAYKIPIASMSINAFTLGCQSVNPDCTTRVVFTNNYFDPTASTQAAKTLVSAGADVIRSIVDDRALQGRETEGVWAVGHYHDFSSTCPGSIVTSTPWDLSNYFKDQAIAIQDGTFESTGSSSPYIIPVSAEDGEPGLGEFDPSSQRTSRTRSTRSSRSSSRGTRSSVRSRTRTAP